MIQRHTQITDSFNIDEFVRTIDPFPTQDILHNLVLLINRLQVVRDITNKQIHINSGFRTPIHNAEVGGKPDSQHLLGKAADIEIEGITPQQVQKLLSNWDGGLGSYKTFTHVDIGPKRRWNG